MKQIISKITLSLCCAFALLWLSGCGSTSSQDGVTIQKKANYNLLDYIPGL
ncbi:hypothetical protein ACWPKS_17905 [Coraliomargarita sp. W4R72]